ncbi:MAG TPA: protein phosphatase 2C domain-containing protein [Polyangiaceae bacterium]|nr:protein phosphatase 2C domain-containing protein [Polyangiaceae bacterium]
MVVVYYWSVPHVLPRFDYRVDYATAFDQGFQRESYEDAALIAPELGVFAIADGMGGHAAGEVAAALAIQEVKLALASRAAQRSVEQYLNQPDLTARRAVFAELKGAVERANQRVFAESCERSEHRGMGSTLDVVWLARGHAFVAHAGDGRVYVARSKTMLQVTQDHTVLAALGSESGRHSRYTALGAALTNAVGLREAVQVDSAFVDVSRGDRLLLCTDGVYNQIHGEAELAELLRHGDAAHSAQALVERARQGGRDNATVVLVCIGERFVRRGERDRGLNAGDLERARQSPLLVDLPESYVLSALTAAVEVEVSAGERIPRLVASDLVAYIVLDGVVFHPASGRRVGAGALVHPESLAGISGSVEPPVAEETTRLLRLRADDFAEVCSEPRLAAELHRRLSQHLARLLVRGP